ncbi:MarR family transcriptional regulator [Microbacterium sp. CFH 31415]|uniref:MarR family winged helix-turn-helix transcriptional regulator n=1 Tax=Microbacterium sp. CFH 31415 TaxID=2921732 RepID=UPI001F131682|nr:MarR family transcriptional regulator [Microbacterium sp. CFH 31415]MCH6230009.1 MarR family transcriptional regulator [Microbacterium sp. CFH 31415]
MTQTTGATADMVAADAPDVAGVLEQLRLAEARLARRRQHESGLAETDRAAMRFLLGRVDADEVTPTMVAHAVHLSPAAGTALIDRLVARGMVHVEPHPRDRRKKLVRPFDRSADPDHLDPLTTRLRELASRLTDHDARIIAAFLESVRAVVSDTATATTVSP